MSRTRVVMRLFRFVLLIGVLAACAPLPKQNLAVAQTSEVRQLTVDGRVREYCLHVPENLSGPVAYVFHFHGGGLADCQDGVIEKRWKAKADAEGFIFVAPVGAVAWWWGGRAWNACSDPPEPCRTVRAENRAEKENVNDVAFFVTLRAALQRQYGVAPVYLNGFSNGGMLVYLLACQVPELVDAASVMGTTAVWQTCSTSPVPFFHMHGNADSQIPWPNGNEIWPSPKAAFERRSAQNGARAESRLEVVDCDHSWPGIARLLWFDCTTAFRAEDRFWEFFRGS